MSSISIKIKTLEELGDFETSEIKKLYPNEENRFDESGLSIRIKTRLGEPGPTKGEK
jgi:hypothetical protein